MINDKSRYIVPNLFTSLNFLLGIWAICYASSALTKGGAYSVDLLVACQFIILSAILDKLDGFAARIMNASSEFGAQFDSLADLIAFGLAPAFALFFAFKELSPEWFSAHIPILIGTLSFYVLCTAMRLAKYNALDCDAYPNHFVGLPSTFGGIIIALMLWLIVDYNFFEVVNPKYFTLPIAITISLSLLMISPLFLPKIKKVKNKLLLILQFINVVIIYIFSFAMIYPEYLAVLAFGYLIIGFFVSFMNRDKIIKDSK